MSIFQVSCLELLDSGCQATGLNTEQRQVRSAVCVCVCESELGVLCYLYKGWVWLLDLYLTVWVFAEVGRVVAMDTAKGMGVLCCVLNWRVCL